MKPHEELIVIADDPIAAVDIPHFCHKGGHKAKPLENWGETPAICAFHVTVAGNSADLDP